MATGFKIVLNRYPYDQKYRYGPYQETRIRNWHSVQGLPLWRQVDDRFFFNRSMLAGIMELQEWILFQPL